MYTKTMSLISKKVGSINVEIDCSVYSGKNETDTTGTIIEKIKASDIF